MNPVPPLRTADDLGLMHDGNVREVFRNRRWTDVFGPFLSSTYGDFDELTTGMRGQAPTVGNDGLPDTARVRLWLSSDRTMSAAEAETCHSRNSISSSVWPLTCLLAALLFLGCRSEGSADSIRAQNPWPPETDQVVDNQFSRDSDCMAWTVVSDSVLAFITDSSESTEPLYRVAGALRLSNGWYVIADGGSSQIRFYDEHGELSQVFGRHGEGPGEFIELSSLHRYVSDSLSVFDRRLQRLSIIHRDATMGRTIDLAVHGASVIGRVEPFASGRFLAVPAWSAGAVQDADRGLHREPLPYLILSRRGEVVDTLGRIPSTEMYYAPTSGGLTAMLPPFGRATVAAVSGKHAFIGTSESFEIVRFTDTGSADLQIRLHGVDRALPEEEYDQAVRDRINNFDGATTRIRRLLESVPRPDDRPAYDAIHADCHENIWVRSYPRSAPQDDSVVEWYVFGPRGRFFGKAKLPARFRPTDVCQGRALGVTEDSYGRERIALLELESKAPTKIGNNAAIR